MRTTLDLPDELFRQVKAKAALEGATLKALLTRYVEWGLRQSPPSARPVGQRSPVPVIKAKGKQVIPNLTSALQGQFEAEEDLARLARSFRR